MKERLIALRNKIAHYRENMLDLNGYTNELEPVHTTSEIMLFLQNIEEALTAMQKDLEMQEKKRINNIRLRNKQIHNG